MTSRKKTSQRDKRPRREIPRKSGKATRVTAIVLIAVAILIMAAWEANIKKKSPDLLDLAATGNFFHSPDGGLAKNYAQVLISRLENPKMGSPENIALLERFARFFDEIGARELIRNVYDNNVKIVFADADAHPNIFAFTDADGKRITFFPAARDGDPELSAFQAFTHAYHAALRARLGVGEVCVPEYGMVRDCFENAASDLLLSEIILRNPGRFPDMERALANYTDILKRHGVSEKSRFRVLQKWFASDEFFFYANRRLDIYSDALETRPAPNVTTSFTSFVDFRDEYLRTQKQTLMDNLAISATDPRAPGHPLVHTQRYGDLILEFADDRMERAPGREAALRKRKQDAEINFAFMLMEGFKQAQQQNLPPRQPPQH